MPLAVIIALAVNTFAEARFGKQALVELALFSQLELGLKDINLPSQTLGHLRGEMFLPK